jgi:hypothetical protein
LDNEDSPIEYEESQRIFWYIINIKILISVKQNKTYFLRQIISNLLSDLSDLSDPKKTKSVSDSNEYCVVIIVSIFF